MRKKSLVLTCILFISCMAFAQQNKWKIAYVHWRDTVSSESWIKIMDQDGSNNSTVIDYPGTNWMPMASGNKIFFQVDRDTAGKKKGLYVYDVRTKKEKFLFEAKGLYQDISFDRKSKLYAGGFSHKPEGNSKSRYDIFLFNENGSFKQLVTNDTAIDLEPVILPGGRQIIFRSNRDRNPKSWAEFELYSINTDGTGLKRLTFNPDTTGNVLRASSPVLAPDGRIAFSGYWDNTYRLMVMNRDGTGIAPLIRMDDMEQASCDFSPDRKKIVFAGRKKGARNYDIYLVNTDGTDLRQLTNDWKRKVQPFFIKSK